MQLCYVCYVCYVMFALAFNFELTFCICRLSFYCMVSPFFLSYWSHLQALHQGVIKTPRIICFFTFLDCTFLDCYLKTSFSRTKKPKRNIIYIFYTQVQKRIYLKIYLKLFSCNSIISD